MSVMKASPLNAFKLLLTIVTPQLTCLRLSMPSVHSIATVEHGCWHERPCWLPLRPAGHSSSPTPRAKVPETNSLPARTQPSSGEWSLHQSHQPRRTHRDGGIHQSKLQVIRIHTALIICLQHTACPSVNLLYYI